MQEQHCDVLVVGGGLGGIAAALAAAKMGKRAVLTEETAWLGGQLTSQAVPPDEHPWIEGVGATASYNLLRRKIRDYYRRNYPLLQEPKQDELLNPGRAFVSPLSHEPMVALAAIEELIAPHRASGRIRTYTNTRPVAAETDGDRIISVTLHSSTGEEPLVVTAPYVIDATELGDLLELAGVEHVMGSESQAQTGEPNALAGEPQPLDQQAHSWCFALSYHPGEDHTIEKPATYDFWRDHQPHYWPAKQLSFTTSNPLSLEPQTWPLFVGEATHPSLDDLWHYRRIFWSKYYPEGAYASDVSVANWPQLDYTLGPLVGVSEEEKHKHIDGSMQLSLSMMYWLQTERRVTMAGTVTPAKT